MRPARGTHPTGTGIQPTTVHAICEGGCALARRCVYGLALASVETRDAMIAMMSDLLIGPASEAGQISSRTNSQISIAPSGLTGLLYGMPIGTARSRGEVAPVGEPELKG